MIVVEAFASSRALAPGMRVRIKANRRREGTIIAIERGERHDRIKVLWDGPEQEVTTHPVRCAEKLKTRLRPPQSGSGT